ncbi:hypothetical protein [Corynebacterium kalidii]
MIQPKSAAPIPDGHKAGVALSDEYVTVSIRREHLDVSIAADIYMTLARIAEGEMETP